MRQCLLVIVVLSTFYANGQNLRPGSFSQLKKTEDTMKIYARKMIREQAASARFVADSLFIRMLVRSLRTPNSFYYPFDSLETVSRIYAPDSTFRIFSWQFTRDEDHYRQRGAIQMKTADGSLQLFPLIDMSDFTTSPQDSVRTSGNWIGAIYYGIVMKTFNNKKYYTLLGFDDYNVRSTRKWIEVLTFNEQGKPVFGGPYFSMKGATDKVKTSPAQARFCLEYKKDGRARMNYDAEMDMIIYDHLWSETNEPDKSYTLVPDGDYQGFKWDNGRWALIDKVFDFKLKDGEAPMPEPIKDDGGKSNEEKLIKQSQKNMGMKETETETPKKTVPKKVIKKPTQPDDQREY
jgi:hypothetical protein